MHCNPVAADAGVLQSLLQWPYSRQTVQWTASGVLQSHFPVRAFYGQVGEKAADTPRQILSLKEHRVKSYEKLTKPWGFAGFRQTK